MTDASEILREAGTPMVNALNPKKKTRVATWNVQTLYQTGKLAQVVTEFDRYKLDFLGITEVRWLGCDKKVLQSVIL